jgi:hypothetical protein
MPPPLEAAAARASRHPFFLAQALVAYQREHALDDAALAAVLGCPAALQTNLRLCRRPSAAEPTWTAERDVLAVARYFNLGAAALERIAREAAAGGP